MRDAWGQAGVKCPCASQSHLWLCVLACCLVDMCRYLSKEGTDLTQFLPLLLDAYLDVQKHPSRAEDTGASSRTMKHLLTRCVNSMSKEYSITTASLALLQHPHEAFSHGFTYCFARPAVAHAVQSQLSDQLLQPGDVAYGPSVGAAPAAGGGHPDGSGEPTSATAAAIAGGIVEEAEDGDAIFAGDALDASRAVSAAVEVQVVGRDVQFLPQHETYQFRGERLAHLTLYEYVMTVRVVTRPKPKGRRGFVQQRRPSNSRFEFDAACPFADTHVQMLRSKFVVPILAGPSPPRHPLLPDDGEATTPAKALELQRCAAFYLVLHVPWIRGSPPLPLTWQSFVAWYTYDGAALPPASAGWDRDAVAACAWMSENVFASRCAREVTASMMAGLRRSAVAAKRMGDYRFRDATRWAAGGEDATGAAPGSGADRVASREGLFDLAPEADGEGGLAVEVARELLSRARARAAVATSNNPDGVHVGAAAAHHVRDNAVGFKPPKV